MAENAEIMSRAAALATVNSPGVTFGKFLEFLENVFFGTFRVLGWLIGRVWFLLFVIALAFSDGYKRGAMVQPRVKQPESQLPRPASDLMDDDRIVDQYQTPFGVPFGPNVHASHD